VILSRRAQGRARWCGARPLCTGRGRIFRDGDPGSDDRDFLLPVVRHTGTRRGLRPLAAERTPAVRRSRLVVLSDARRVFVERPERARRTD